MHILKIKDEIKKIFPLRIALKIKRLGINLTTEIVHQNTKIYWKKLRELNKWEDTQVHGSEDLIFLKWEYSPQLIYWFNTILIKIPTDFLKKKLAGWFQNFYGNLTDPE